jgi:hypothetical protein
MLLALAGTSPQLFKTRHGGPFGGELLFTVLGVATLGLAAVGHQVVEQLTDGARSTPCHLVHE